MSTRPLTPDCRLRDYYGVVGALQTQKLRSPLLRTMSVQNYCSPFKPDVGQNIAMYASPVTTARDCFFILIFTIPVHSSPFYLSVSVPVCLCLSVCLSLCLSLSVCLCLCLSVCLSLSLSLCLSLSLSLPVPSKPYR